MNVVRPDRKEPVGGRFGLRIIAERIFRLCEKIEREWVIRISGGGLARALEVALAPRLLAVPISLLVIEVEIVVTERDDFGDERGLASAEWPHGLHHRLRDFDLDRPVFEAALGHILPRFAVKRVEIAEHLRGIRQ